MSFSAKKNAGLLDLTPNVTEAVVDIVFVHGLQGDGVLTWTHEEYGVFWPKDFLAKDIKNARILTWFYDSAVMRFWTETTTNNIDSNAANLCADLTNLRAETKSQDRHIIFVAHSLGGLLCANALVLGSQHAENDVKNIAEHTRGMIFLGTPHEGADLARWATLGLQFLKLDNNGKATRDLEVLKKESSKLRDLSTAFGMLLRSHGESQDPQQKIEIVVSQASASISGYEAIGIPDNHRNMAKFKSTDDIGYRRVSGYLKKWVKKLGETQVAEKRDGDQIKFTGNVIGGQMIGKISGGSTRFDNTINFGEAAVEAFLKQKKQEATDGQDDEDAD
ncbi:hypothetical protein N431DRAFT_523969 [Stipitochalara longipes BDJ]|nr:hypothetical protein N431DRAFT_523969 [Stipitochalara longipes BDJ]